MAVAKTNSPMATGVARLVHHSFPVDLPFKMENYFVNMSAIEVTAGP